MYPLVNTSLYVGFVVVWYDVDGDFIVLDGLGGRYALLGGEYVDMWTGAGVEWWTGGRYSLDGGLYVDMCSSTGLDGGR